METTIWLMRKLASQATDRLRSKTPEKLVVEYRKNENTRSIVVALCWEQMLGLIVSISDPFYSLASDEKASIAQLCIVRTIEKYRIGQGVKFSTLFHTIYKRALVSALRRNIEKYEVEDLSELEKMGEEENYEFDSGRLLIDIERWLEDTQEKPRILEYCKLIMDNEFDTITEIAEQLGISRTTIYTYQRKLKTVLEEHGISL